MIIQILLLAVGFIILVKGADIFVDGASSIAKNFKVSKMLIGLTIVALGTSAPELAISIKSIVSNNYDIVLGNIIGSNIMNVLLILGICSLFHTLYVKNNTIKKELPLTILITVLFAVLISDNLFDKNLTNMFSRSDGIILLLFFLVFVYYLFSMSRNKTDDDLEEKKLPLWKAVLYAVGGIIFIVLGSNFVVDSASDLAENLGVSQKLISLTIVAFGTSLPELVTSITASIKGEHDIAIGNIVGSNIFNIGLVMGIPTAILGGIHKINFSYIDLAVMVLSSILLFAFCYHDRKIDKKQGIIFLILFAIYYSYVIFSG